MDSVSLNFTVSSDSTDLFMKALKEMQAKEVLAGFPEDESPRQDEDGKPEAITNAALGYIHNFGAPEQNIPARPFMIEGIVNVSDRISDRMYQAGAAALDGNGDRVDQSLVAVGITAQLGIQGKINDGPFEPLAESTLKARAARGRVGAQDELDRRAAGEEPGTADAKPLIDTAQMRNAVTFVVVDK